MNSTFTSKITSSDIFQWDVVNWSRALKVWSKECASVEGAKVLAIGERDGGLTLWLASLGAHVICSDLRGPSEKARQIHDKFGVMKSVSYASIDVLNIPYENNYFDLVVFKSVLGALKSPENQARAMSEILRVLRSDGKLLFAENLTGSKLHMFARRMLVRWATHWRYVNIDELRGFTHEYSNVSFKFVGFLGVFGGFEKFRCLLGIVDSLTDWMCPQSWRYIAVGICQK